MRRQRKKSPVDGAGGLLAKRPHLSKKKLPGSAMTMVVQLLLPKSGQKKEVNGPGISQSTGPLSLAPLEEMGKVVSSRLSGSVTVQLLAPPGQKKELNAPGKSNQRKLGINEVPTNSALLFDWCGLTGTLFKKLLFAAGFSYRCSLALC